MVVILLRHNLDVIHVEKNVCDSLIGTIMNIDGKSKNTTNAWLDLENLNVRPQLHLVKNGNKWIKPLQNSLCQLLIGKSFTRSFIKSVKFPDASTLNLTRNITDNDRNITDNDSKITGLTSYDCHVLMQRLLPVGIHPFSIRTLRQPLLNFAISFSKFVPRLSKWKILRKLKSI